MITLPVSSEVVAILVLDFLCFVSHRSSVLCYDMFCSLVSFHSCYYDFALYSLLSNFCLLLCQTEPISDNYMNNGVSSYLCISRVEDWVTLLCIFFQFREIVWFTPVSD